MVEVPPTLKDTVHIDMSRETTIAESVPTKLSGLEGLREKMSPMLLYVVSTAQFLDIVNGASVAVALLPIAKDLQFKVPEMLWILNAYTIAFAGLLLVSGRLGDLFGHRLMFMLGLFWFSTWSLVVSFSTSPIMFIIARALQGMGAAGILLAGGLISSIGWAWIFRISSIAGYLLLALAFIAIPLTPLKTEKPKIDYLGAITATLGVTGVVYYISTGVDDGWASPKTLPMLFIGLILLGVFTYTEYKVESPLMPLRIWKNNNFTASVVLAFVSMGMFQGVIYYANMVFQEVYGWTSIQTALGFLVHSLLAVVVFAVLGRVLPRLPLKPLILTGFVLRCVTALMFAFVNEHTSYWHIPFPAFILHIFGVGLSLLPIQITAVRDAENKDQGLVGAIYNTGLQLGAPFGIAILNVISLSTNGKDAHSGPLLMEGYKNAFFGIVIMGAFGFLLAMAILPWDKPNRPAKNITEVIEESKDLEVGSSIVSDDDSDTITIASQSERTVEKSA
ncbi:hypothetical protein BGZ75_007681 [Mortierella antarctica]|nr:hypothetical protein BGZ75_007681 [Mortierella antarctica]